MNMNIDEQLDIIESAWDDINEWGNATFDIENGRVVAVRNHHYTSDCPDSMYWGEEEGLDPDNEWREWIVTEHESCEILTPRYVLREVLAVTEEMVNGYVQWSTGVVYGYDEQDGEPNTWFHAMLPCEVPAE